MTKKIVNSVKYIGLFSLVLLSIIACERDFENIGVGLVDNSQFTTNDAVFEVTAYNKNIEASRVDGIPEYLLGILQDDNFGYLKTSFISQLGLAISTDFGENVSIDAVILDIPYFVTDTSTTGIPDFKLDSIFGNQETEYKLSVYESGTFMNILDPLDPSKRKKYYSDEQYEKKATLYSQLFKPNRNDTVVYINRRFLDDDVNTIDDIDTVKADNLVPSVKMSLDTTFFRNNFVNQQAAGIFDSNDDFINFFRGIIIEAEEDINKDGSLMVLAMSEATMNIYYTNTILTDEVDVDLNDNGTTDDIEVPVRTKQTMIFPVNGVRTNLYSRDYSNSNINDRFINTDSINGEDKLFIHGAAGSTAVIELFKGISLDSIQSIRDQNWLINEANLTLYLDQNIAQDNLPEQLLLYNYDSNSQILDVITEGQIGGILERNDDGEPVKYKFRITDYISELLKLEGANVPLVKFGLKVFHSSDLPVLLTDTIIDDYSWIAKGAVLNGNNIPSTNSDYSERLKLEIFYTINND